MLKKRHPFYIKSVFFNLYHFSYYKVKMVVNIFKPLRRLKN